MPISDDPDQVAQLMRGFLDGTAANDSGSGTAAGGRRRAASTAAGGR